MAMNKHTEEKKNTDSHFLPHRVLQLTPLSARQIAHAVILLQPTPQM